MEYKKTLDELFAREGVAGVRNFFTNHEGLAPDIAEDKLKVMGYITGTVPNDSINFTSVSTYDLHEFINSKFSGLDNKYDKTPVDSFWKRWASKVIKPWHQQ